MRSAARNCIAAGFAAVMLLGAAPAGTRVDTVAFVLPNTTVHKFHSRENEADYVLYIRVPPDYAKSQKFYPVIYMLDADYAFPVTVNIADMLGRRFEQAQETILVAIGYPGQYPSEEKYRRNRTRDYTPPAIQVAGATVPKNSGGAARFLHVIEREVIPYIEETYRTDAADRTLVGHSYGGLFAAWVLQERPELFHRYLMVSPSLWYNDGMILAREESETMLPLSRRTQIYMAIGSTENIKNGPQMIDDLNRFAKALAMRRDPNLVVEHRVFEDETHASIFPIAFSTGLRHLFGEMDGRVAPPSTAVAGTGH